ncbi:MAG: Arginine--tRNA ligase [Chlamydiae bacterium]|nr:Arginine--tRNA ligase [Chlamydiota bacterium]
MHWSNTSLLTTQLSKIFKLLIEESFPDLSQDQIAQVLEVTVSKQAGHGHYQCNSALKLSKLVKDNPRSVANKLLLKPSSLIESCEVAGPGFINITISKAFLEKELNKLLKDQRLGISATNHPKRVIVEFSSPNTAKELHVGHLRSTIIGDCLSRLFEFLGHDVLRLNHIGNWGTPFGMLIHYLKTKHPKVLTGEEKTDLTHLALWYKESRVLFDNDEKFKKSSQAQVIKLQAHEPEAILAWKKICEISRVGYQEIYDLLDVKITERGESFYHDLLEQIVDLFEKKNLVKISNGAKCVFLDDFTSKVGSPLPIIIQKSDGGYNYSSTDLSALFQRINEEKADRIIYVVDNGQSLHFQMVFKAAQLAGYYNPCKTDVDHVPFGLVLGSDGKKFKTRSGDSEKLIDLLKKSIAKATHIINERDTPSLDVEQTAKVLGINAVKYADLSSLRTKDYTFSYEKMLQFEGNTAAFLLYAYVRIVSIQTKANFKLQSLLSSQIVLTEPSETELALSIIQLREILESVAHSLLPNRLCDYLYQLAEKFHSFFRDCQVLNADEQNSRLLLCELVKRAFEIGFSILGLQTVTKM